MTVVVDRIDTHTVGLQLWAVLINKHEVMHTYFLGTNDYAAAWSGVIFAEEGRTCPSHWIRLYPIFTMHFVCEEVFPSTAVGCKSHPDL